MIRLSQPQFTDADRVRIEDILTTGMLVQGRYVAEFEALVSAWLQTPTVACANGTAALHLALLACGIGEGDEVLVPAFTWPSTAHVIVQTGARPVFVDIESERLGMDPEQAVRRLTERTRAVLPVHLFGVACDYAPLEMMANAHGLKIIEDAACALGTRLDDGRLAGTAGDIGCFSLHPRKVITTGEGGLLSTSDAGLMARLHALRNHGMLRTPDGIQFVEAGLNYRLPELGGALGVGQMGMLDGIIERRRVLAARYMELLKGLPVRVPAGMTLLSTVPQSFVVDLSPAAGPSYPVHELRQAVMARMLRSGIETTIGTYSVVDQPVYAAQGVRGADYPVAWQAARALLTLPLHPLLTDSDIEVVVRVLHESLDSVVRGSSDA
jgi:dTDP-4-amino-4,6-dideoxygalactose transaminase